MMKNQCIFSLLFFLSMQAESLKLASPASAEDLATTVTDSGALLFVSAVGSFEKTIATTKRNVQHLRATHPGRVDVFLFHYDKQQAKWMADSSSRDWYKENIQGFMEEEG